jgi:hypothetical protein
MRAHHFARRGYRCLWSGCYVQDLPLPGAYRWIEMALGCSHHLA